ncbi:MAG: helix-turn-helix transcriptional regulator [Lachnospiraceae bacterium]
MKVHGLHCLKHAQNDIMIYQIPVSEHIFYTGTSLELQNLFRQMIQELQMCRLGYEELLALGLQQLFLLIQRKMTERDPEISGFVHEEAETARRYFNEHSHEPISIEDYAASRSMSTGWFIRSFKQLTGNTPMQYILSIRIMNAQSLLENTEYSVTEISEIVGYENPLYFSRLFNKGVPKNGAGWTEEGSGS